MVFKVLTFLNDVQFRRPVTFNGTAISSNDPIVMNLLRVLLSASNGSVDELQHMWEEVLFFLRTHSMWDPDIDEEIRSIVEVNSRNAADLYERQYASRIDDPNVEFKHHDRRGTFLFTNMPNHGNLRWITDDIRGLTSRGHRIGSNRYREFFTHPSMRGVVLMTDHNARGTGRPGFYWIALNQIATYIEANQDRFGDTIPELNILIDEFHQDQVMFIRRVTEELLKMRLNTDGSVVDPSYTLVTVTPKPGSESYSGALSP